MRFRPNSGERSSLGLNERGYSGGYRRKDWIVEAKETVRGAERIVKNPQQRGRREKKKRNTEVNRADTRKGKEPAKRTGQRISIWSAKREAE